MGAGGSAEVQPSPSYGVRVNPRLEYATGKSRSQGGDNVLLDAPSLVKLQHGTVRYRYLGEGADANEVTPDRVERPHEGEERHKKHGYFYHSKLNDFSDVADPAQEEAWKFCYVYKGAKRTRQKQLYYVFGKGLKTNEKGFIEPKYHSKEENPEETIQQQGSNITTSSSTQDNKKDKFYKYHGHMYYDVEFVPQNEEQPEKKTQDDDIEILGDGQVKMDDNEVVITVHDKDTIQRVKRRLAVKMFKPATHFHLYQFGEELERDELASVCKPRGEEWTRFKLMLKPMESVQHN